jgi:hypothetical protein
MSRQSVYYLASYVPTSLANDESYCQAMRDRITALMEMQDYTIDEIVGPVIFATPDCPPPDGMVNVQVTAKVHEFDTWIDSSIEDGQHVVPASIHWNNDAYKTQQRARWQRFDGGGEYHNCARCGQVCELKESPKTGQRVLCDPCKTGDSGIATPPS